MSTIDELKTSIQQYKTQLYQVTEALKFCKTETEKLSLENLKSDLNELLELTQETLDEQNVATSSNNQNDPFADEMDLFMAEIKQTESHIPKPEPRTQEDDDLDRKIDAIKSELTALVGKKCSAPHIHSWGAKAYHNALVCGIDDTTEYDENDFDNIKVKVLFTNPTHREMIPCSYYLDGDCRFDAEKCRFSHGELVLYKELKEYRDPDFSLLHKAKLPVLVKQNDRMWYKGRVVSSNFNEKTCQIKLDQSKKEISCEFEDVLPVHEVDPFIESSDLESSTDDEYEEMQQARLIEKSLLTPAPDQAMGEWEKHTKGFGSKIMQKFGYIIGTGLGHNGEGIIVPISAQILPPGRSLDHCMELREQANGDKDLFSVERKLKQRKHKQEQINIKAYEREKQKTNVFHFINENVFASNKEVPVKNDTKQDFKNHSTKHLNVAGFKIGEDIRKVERDIQKVKESMSRHKSGTPVYNKLKEQLDGKTSELASLKKSEITVAKEQVFRKDKTKLTIF